MFINGTSVGQGRYNDSTLPNSTIGGMRKFPESPTGGHVQRLRGCAPVYTYYIYVCSANGIGSVNAVGTHCIASSSPYFPPYVIHKTTSVARGTSTSAQPYYLMYYIKGWDKARRESSLNSILITI